MEILKSIKIIRSREQIMKAIFRMRQWFALANI